MPPKPRGRGTTRGQASRRGGTAAGRAATTAASETPAAATPPQIDAGASESQSVVPKQEVGGESSTPDATANNGEAPSIQRVGSLKSAEPASRSASPAARRGTSTRGKKAAPKPTFTGRRSKEERDALAKADMQRDKERNKEWEAAMKEKAKQKEIDEKKKARAATKARGGYSGVSGPFSMGSAARERASSNRGLSGIGSGSGSRGVRVKSEHGEGGGGGGGSSRGSGGGFKGSGTAIKAEDGGEISSEDDDDVSVPRRDIDLIEISSDEDHADPAEHKIRGTLPVRIGRREHQQRVMGINTDASSEASAKILQEAEASGSAPTADVLQSAQRKGKGKGKAKEFEITDVRKPYQGMWQDEDDEPSVRVKEEPASDEEMAGAEQVGIGASPEDTGKQPEPSEDASKKPKVRFKGPPEPVFQTEEDRAEWKRYQANLRHIRAELGPEETPAAAATAGSGEDANMADAAAKAAKPSVRDNNVYLFQFPPIMPELVQPGIKKEPESQEAAPAPKPDDKKPIKVEEGFSDPSAKPAGAPRYASGHVGKLRVHESGRTTLDWGGTNFELRPGIKVSFLQEAVSVNIVPPKDRVVQEDAGEAISMGRVKGKFIVSPDWDSIL